MRLFIFSSIYILTLTSSIAQNINIDNTTVFKDGIYASYEDFVNNDPSYSAASFHIEWKETPLFNVLKMKSCKSNKNGKIKKTDMRKIWGICVNGVPYIQYSMGVPYRLNFGNKATDSYGKSSFSRIRILGNLCHFNIEDKYQSRKRTMSRNGLFSKDVKGGMIRAQRILKLASGEIYEYDEFILSRLIKDDELLANQFKQESDRKYKMFLYLQKYNERNPVSYTRI